MMTLQTTPETHPQATPPKAARWQLVLIAWGMKYPVEEINRLARSVVRVSQNAPRIVLLSDRERAGLDAGIRVVRFPEYWLRPEFCTGGCQAKLAMFEAGVVPDDLPALYIDLDTMILRDVEPILAALKSKRSIAILQSAILPFGAVARALYRLTKGKRYARGNSSVVAFYPSECAYIAEEFKRLEALHGARGFKPLWADERFISWSTQPHIQAVSHRDAVKFPTEFMFPWRWLARFLQALPWVAKRRAELRAVTFPGFEVKFEELTALADGDEVVDRKGRRLVWSQKYIGDLKGRILAYWSQ